MREFTREILLPILATIGYILLICVVAPYEAEGQAYVRAFNTTRVVNVSDASGLTTALNSAAAGDAITLADGTYTGSFAVNRAGSSTNAILIKASGHAIIDGTFLVTGAHNYIMGLEITGGPGGKPGIELQCGNCGAINNYTHSVNGAVGIFGYNAGANQVIYGNIIGPNVSTANNPHNIYTQNDYNAFGYKYFIGNYIYDAAAVTGSTFSFHGYTEGGFISGIHFERNISENGRFLIGGWNVPHFKHIVKQNNFYKSDVQLGYKRKLTFTLEDNILGRSGFKTEWMTGEGETDPTLQDPTIVRRNKVIFPNGNHMTLFNSPTTANLRSTLVWNDNEYYGPFRGALNAGGGFACCVTLFTDWKNFAASKGGVNFDTTSINTTATPSNEYSFIQNEYDPNQGLLAVYNWEGLTSATHLRAGSFSVYRAKDPYGPAVVSGTDSVSIPLSSEFEVFLIKGLTVPPDPDPTCDLATAYQLALDIMNERLDPFTTHAQKVRRMGKKDLELIECLELMEE